MTDSLFFSMGNRSDIHVFRILQFEGIDLLFGCLCSRQLAEEVLRGGEETGEEEEETGSGFEGMEALTRAIETGERK